MVDAGGLDALRCVVGAKGLACWFEGEADLLVVLLT